MGKIDDLRKQRERQFARAEEQRAANHAANGVVNGVESARSEEGASLVAREPEVSKARARSAGKDAAAGKHDKKDEQGKCGVCGKLRAMNNGVLANHQKGLGKMCPGSRTKPV